MVTSLISLNFFGYTVTTFWLQTINFIGNVAMYCTNIVECTIYKVFLFNVRNKQKRFKMNIPAIIKGNDERCIIIQIDQPSAVVIAQHGKIKVVPMGDLIVDVDQWLKPNSWWPGLN